MARQFVVQLKNQPGALAILAEALAARSVDLRAIGGGSIGDSGHVIMTTADDDATKEILDEGQVQADMVMSKCVTHSHLDLDEVQDVTHSVVSHLSTEGEVTSVLIVR